jgi:arginase
MQKTLTNHRDRAVIDAPSNLGLRPPADGAVPGVYKLAGALRDHGIVRRLGAADGGVVVPPRYYSAWRPGTGVRNGEAIHAFSLRLAERVGDVIGDGVFPIVLGGDCSILLGNLLALRRRGRCGLVFVDGHSDFRHPGNADAVGAAAGEELALVTGRGGTLAHLEGRAPMVEDRNAVVIGIRDDDPHAPELTEAGVRTFLAREVSADPAHVAAQALATFTDGLGYWIHVDVDVLDPELMPAVDSPASGGIDFDTLATLLRPLLSSSAAAGIEITIFDPDLDPTGEFAADVVECICSAFDP